MQGKEKQVPVIIEVKGLTQGPRGEIIPLTMGFKPVALWSLA